ncbi:carbohydrate esterase family 8 protein [Diplodia corticola]|uniref:Pectinesterase n=1 Tax=Diplodia corticola TaxID=236234 RepID=A0A1J9RQP4_9PEZI|nr:carbohydrate esterase family 8 protein [Diplodia corticola]OJD30767.1 carbohydrate esterase family 8 protein [Diplodia corticola]
MPSLTTILAIAAPALALSSPPSGALTVGSSGDYSTIQDAVDALSTSSSSEQVIFIYSGTYSEQVVIPALSGALSVYGQSDDETSYGSNTVTISAGKSQDDGLDNDGTATLAVHTGNVKVYNLNVENTRGSGSQAVALSAYASGNHGYYGLKLTGFQDTLLAQQGTQIYANSYIEGATDFIFGQQAVAWFENCDIRVASASVGYLTANGRDSDSNPSYYVISNSNVAAADGASVASGAIYLGRPWRNYARVVFQDTALADIINAAGWAQWSSSDTRTDAVTFAEYGNTGDGASTSSRASFSEQLSSAVSMSDVLGSDYSDWVDSSYI